MNKKCFTIAGMLHAETIEESGRLRTQPERHPSEHRVAKHTGPRRPLTMPCSIISR
jgi:hypothetical protein